MPKQSARMGVGSATGFALNTAKYHNAHTPGYVLSHERATFPVLDDLLVVLDLHEYLFGG